MWLLEFLLSRMTTEDILADDEALEVEDIYVVLAYATKLTQVKHTVVVAACMFLSLLICHADSVAYAKVMVIQPSTRLICHNGTRQKTATV